MVPILVGLFALFSGIFIGEGGVASLNWVVSDIAIPLLSTFLGAYFAFAYSNSERAKSEKEELLNAVNAISIELNYVNSCIESIREFRTELEGPENGAFCARTLITRAAIVPIPDFSAISRLAGHDDGEALSRLRALFSDYAALVAAVDERNLFVEKYLDPVYESLLGNMQEGFPVKVISDELGARRIFQLKSHLKNIDDGLEVLKASVGEASTALDNVVQKALGST